MPHEHKEVEPIEEVGIISLLKEDQLSMHDCDPTYFRYMCQHATCRPHLLKDLKAVEDKYGLKWPSHMRKLLTDARLKKSHLKKEIAIDTISKDTDQSLQKKRMKKKLKESQKIIRRRLFKKRRQPPRYYWKG